MSFVGLITAIGVGWVVWVVEEIRKRIIIMAITIQDFAKQQNQFNDRIDAAITGLEGDVKTLNDTIVKLQTNPGPISTEDQALLDALQTRGQAIADKLDALDALTPPTPPTA